MYGWEFYVDDIAAVMQGLAIECAHVVGLSMGGYAALQFGLRYPEKASAVVACAVGSGSLPSQREAWFRETSILAHAFIERGMGEMAERMAPSPTRIQLQYKDPKGWRDFVVRLRQHSARGMSNTMALPGFAAAMSRTLPSLASDDSAFMYGAGVVIDGGFFLPGVRTSGSRAMAHPACFQGRWL